MASPAPDLPPVLHPLIEPSTTILAPEASLVPQPPVDPSGVDKSIGVSVETRSVSPGSEILSTEPPHAQQPPAEPSTVNISTDASPVPNPHTEPPSVNLFAEAPVETHSNIPAPIHAQVQIENPAVGNNNDNLEADEAQTLENDSAFGDEVDNQSERTSLSSGITKYREENGRRYHAFRDGVYLLPNDDKEQDRLDLHHHVFSLVYDGTLCQAPIDNPSRVLDVGTGTGIWAIDFADAHPASHVIGMDLSPIQPGWVPPNLEFVVDDAEDDWTGHRYDFVHVRMAAGAIKDWERLLAQTFAHLQPGGWAEFTEFEVWMYSNNDDLLHHGGKTILEWQTGLNDAARKFGRTFDVAVNLRRWVEAAGFELVREDVRKVPCGPWPRDRRMKEIGLYQQQNMLDAASSYGQAHFTRVLGWSIDEYAVLSATVRNELRNPRLHLYSNL